MKEHENIDTPLSRFLSKAGDRVDPKVFAGGIPQERGTMPQLRVGKRWFTTAQMLVALVPIGFVTAIVAVAAAQQLRMLPAVQDFIRSYPGTGDFAPPVTSGFPWWLRYQHFLNFFMMLFIMRSGIQILMDHPRLYLDPHCTPGREWMRFRGAVPPDPEWTARKDCVAIPGWLGLPGLRHAIGLARIWHFSLDTLWLVNGLVFCSLLFYTGQWQRIVPQSLSIFPNALSTAIQYASLDFPVEKGWVQYNGLQVLAYFITVFIAAPLAMVTGMLQSPAIAARFGLAKGPLNRQVMRTIHFGILIYFIVFILAHVAMVFSTGLLQNLNHITRGVNDRGWEGLGLFLAGIALAFLCWLTATPFTLRYPRLLQNAGYVIFGWMKVPLERLRPVAEFREKDISPYFWKNGTAPDSDEYKRLAAGGFADFKLKVGGLVDHPQDIPFQALKDMGKSEQITQQYCIQGWSGIAKWGGVPIARIMDLVKPHANVRYVVFYSFAGGPGTEKGLYYDVHKIEHMRHKHAILAYEMNGATLPFHHGAPLRLRNELELGFKQVKWVQGMDFVENFESLGASEGGFNEDHEFFDVRAPI